jgi:hypothetical protein
MEVSRELQHGMIQWLLQSSNYYNQQRFVPISCGIAAGVVFGIMMEDLSITWVQHIQFIMQPDQ